MLVLFYHKGIIVDLKFIVSERVSKQECDLTLMKKLGNFARRKMLELYHHKHTDSIQRDSSDNNG